MASTPSATRIPRTKVCGVTRSSDLDVLARVGVDAVGINLVPTSPRCVEVARAARLSARAAELGLLRVAVFMNATPGELAEALGSVAVDLVQLHGEEQPDLLGSIPPELPIVKAVSWSGQEAEERLAEEWCGSERLVAWLIDAFAPGQGGGTGKQARWDLLLPRPAVLASHPVILAGGLRPGNVARAIHATKPHGVDTASGVESRPGEKDADLVGKFASNAIAAFHAAGDQL